MDEDELTESVAALQQSFAVDASTGVTLVAPANVGGVTSEHGF